MPAYPAPLEPVPRLEAAPDDTAILDSNAPADLDARPPLAPGADDDDGLPPGVIAAIVVPLLLLLFVCLGVYCLLWRRKRQRLQHDVTIKQERVASAGFGSQNGAAAMYASAIRSLPCEKSGSSMYMSVRPADLSPALPSRLCVIYLACTVG